MVMGIILPTEVGMHGRNREQVMSKRMAIFDGGERNDQSFLVKKCGEPRPGKFAMA
jgi:hypothetical protein